jgi:hypothetical protein
VQKNKGDKATVKVPAFFSWEMVDEQGQVTDFWLAGWSLAFL